MCARFLAAGMDPSMCKVRGRGVQPEGLRVPNDSPASFSVDTTGAGDGSLECRIVDRSAVLL